MFTSISLAMYFSYLSQYPIQVYWYFYYLNTGLSFFSNIFYKSLFYYCIFLHFSKKCKSLPTISGSWRLHFWQSFLLLFVISIILYIICSFFIHFFIRMIFSQITNFINIQIFWYFFTIWTSSLFLNFRIIETFHDNYTNLW